MAILHEILAVLYIIITVIPITILLIIDRIHKLNSTFMYKILITWINGIGHALGVKIKYKGKENFPKNKGFVIVGNHLSNFDSFAVGMSLKRDVHFHFISKIELGKFFYLKWLVEAVDAYLMDRNDPRQSLKVISAAANHVKQGECVLIFPAGTRGTVEDRLEFKAGSLKIAKKAKAPIVPMTLINVRHFYEDEKKFQPGTAYTYYHPIIEYDVYKDKDLNEFAKELENITYDFTLEDFEKVKEKNE